MYIYKASIDRVLLTSFYNYAEPHLPEHIQESLRSLKQVSDLRFPAEWFPEARQMQRYVDCIVIISSAYYLMSE